jgi:uncharacterized protein
MSALSPVTVDCFQLNHPSGEGLVQIAVSKPEGLPEEAAGIPVLFVLDGDVAFAAAAELARVRSFGGGLPPVYVVGIGYGADFAEFAKLRTGDLTPPTSAAGTSALGGVATLIGDQSGGADAFLAFLIDVLVPEIGARYPQTNPQARHLFGHSLGGLFVSYALMTRPSAFSSFIASSPSLWWDGFAALSHLPALKEAVARDAQNPRVLVAVGGKEQDVPTEVPASLPMALADVQAMVAASRMVDAAREFAEAIRDAGLDRVEHVVFDGEDHGSVVPAAISRALSFALALV